MQPESSTLVDSFHIESHAALLQRPTGEESSPGTLDAIVVPTIRPDSLQAAMDLAHDVGCLLVVLCTTEVQARKIIAKHNLSPGPGGDIFVAHVPPTVGDGLLNFLTSAHPETATKIKASCHVDIARKRNVGLLLARICGWRTVMYLDDDIRNLSAAAVTGAAAHIEYSQAVGFEIEHYPDNSVVCHAHRLAGARQDVFPGGSALLIDAPRSNSLFPPIYNEDWLFLLAAVQNRSFTVAGKLTQLAYDPFAHSRRAASEEFGDVIAEGLYRLLHERAGPADAALDYWTDALRRRAQLIDDIATRLLLLDEGQPVIGTALISLTAARKRLDTITPLACVSFLRAWRSDLGDWTNRLASLPVLGDVRHAAKFLHLPIIDAKVIR